jgi:hypothetical protein
MTEHFASIEGTLSLFIDYFFQILFTVRVILIKVTIIIGLQLLILLSFIQLTYLSVKCEISSKKVIVFFVNILANHVILVGKYSLSLLVNWYICFLISYVRLIWQLFTWRRLVVNDRMSSIQIKGWVTCRRPPFYVKLRYSRLVSLFNLVFDFVLFVWNLYFFDARFVSFSRWYIPLRVVHDFSTPSIILR